jgi:uncharacterized protein (TIGR02271 family)
MQSNSTQVQPGWDVIGSDDQKIGEVTEVGSNYVVLTKGLIFPKDLYVPLNTISSVDADASCVYLNVAKDDVDSMGWDQIPADDGVATGDYGSSYDATTVGTDAATATNRTTIDDDATYAGGTDTMYSGGTDDRTTGRADASDTLRVPVHEEQLRASTQQSEAGEVAINKNVVQERQELDVPVTHEEVDIKRVRVDRSDANPNQAFTQDGETIRVPLTAEQVVVDKDTRVVEELEISKRPVTETQRVSETVRREEVNVDEDDAFRHTGSDRELAGAGTGASYMSGTTDVDGDSGTNRDRGLLDRVEDALDGDNDRNR